MTTTARPTRNAGGTAEPLGPDQPVPSSEAEALGSVEGGEPVGVPSPRGIARTLLSVVAQPGPLAREAARLGRATVRILRGTDATAPAPKDKRFTDPAWTLNPVYRRLAQEYQVFTGSLTRLVDEHESGGADWREVEQARFLVNAIISTLAPTNTLPGNPAALKRAFDTAGRSVVRGLGHMLHDLRHNGGLPAQTDRTAFTVGEDLGVTPGVVVHRSEV